MKNGKIVFFGTSAIGLSFLHFLQESFDIRMVVTQPDAPGGRGRQLICPPPKSFARENSCQLEQPDKLRDPVFIRNLKAIRPDIGVVVAYGKLIPEAVYTIPRFHTINVHFSLLPRYRGAAPVQRALENGEETTGITIFEINRRLDAGDIWSRKEFDIFPEDTSATLMDRLSREGAPFLIRTIRDILENKIVKIPQNHEQATLAPPLRKEEGRVDWNLTAAQLKNRFRAFTPWPGLFFTLKQRLVKIKKITPLEITPDLGRLMKGRSPGETVKMDETGLVVCCGGPSLARIEEFQPEGKKSMTPYCFSLGNPLPGKLN
jgi:methionyl-tRNA formyltransferase